MIFVTVGTQLPFDRLVGAMDGWARQHPVEPVIAQVGSTRARFPNLDARPWFSRRDHDRLLRDARVVVAHAGMGSVLTALGAGVPIAVMPRLARLGEHRDDHQLETARRLAALRKLVVAWDERELPDLIDALLAGPGTPCEGTSGRSQFVASFGAIVRCELALAGGAALLP